MNQFLKSRRRLVGGELTKSFISLFSSLFQLFKFPDNSSEFFFSSPPKQDICFRKKINWVDDFSPIKNGMRSKLEIFVNKTR